MGHIKILWYAFFHDDLFLSPFFEVEPLIAIPSCLSGSGTGDCLRGFSGRSVEVKPVKKTDKDKWIDCFWTEIMSGLFTQNTIFILIVRQVDDYTHIIYMAFFLLASH
jgi:hypothetical protein